MTSTAWTAANLPDLSEQTVVVTGASGGLGFHTAKALADAGAHVVLAVRNLESGAHAAAEIGGGTAVRRLDLADLASVRAFAADWSGPLDILINNAGVMAPPQGSTVDGFELQIGTNHLGPFVLTNLLLPHITRRVVTVSSQLHSRAKLDPDDLNWKRRSYNAAQAYSDSKLANLLFILELQRQLRQNGSPVIAVSAHPGVARTNLGKSSIGQLGRLERLFGWMFSDPQRAAQSIEYAATEAVDGGAYVGPDGLAHMRGNPSVHQPIPAALDAGTARRLWQLSAELTEMV